MNRPESRLVVLFLVGLSGALASLTRADDTLKSQNAGDRPLALEEQVFQLPTRGTITVHRRSGSGPVLFIIPGTWGDVQSLTPLIEQLPDEMAIVVIELCWQGGQIPPTCDLSIEQLASDVLWVISKLQPDGYYLSGHSIGGMIAVEICGRDSPGLIGVIPIEGWSHHSVVQTAFEGQVVGTLTPSQQDLRRTDRARGQQHLSVQQRAAIGTIWRRWNGWDCLERSTVPILHIWGDRGRSKASPKDMQIPERPGIEIVWIAGASHALVVEAPEALAKAMRDFMDRTTIP